MQVGHATDAVYSQSYETDALQTIISCLEVVYKQPMEKLPRVGNAVDIDSVIRLLDNDTDGTTTINFDYQDHRICVSPDTVSIY